MKIKLFVLFLQGLPNSNHELSLANFQAFESNRVVNEIFENMALASRGEGYENVRFNVAEKILKQKEHAAVHSISRNY